MFLANIQEGSSLGLRIAWRATPKLMSTTNMMMTKYIMSIIWQEEGKERGVALQNDQQDIKKISQKKATPIHPDK